MREEIRGRQDLKRRETQRLSSARLLQLPLDSEVRELNGAQTMAWKESRSKRLISQSVYQRHPNEDRGGQRREGSLRGEPVCRNCRAQVFQ